MDPQKNDKIVSKIERILDQVTSKYICRIDVDPEPEEGVYWVKVVFNSDYSKLSGFDRLNKRLELCDQIEKLVTNFLGVPCVCGITIDENC